MVNVGTYTIDGWYGQEISNITHGPRTPLVEGERP